MLRRYFMLGLGVIIFLVLPTCAAKRPPSMDSPRLKHVRVFVSDSDQPCRAVGAAARPSDIFVSKALSQGEVRGPGPDRWRAGHCDRSAVFHPTENLEGRLEPHDDFSLLTVSFSRQEWVRWYSDEKDPRFKIIGIVRGKEYDKCPERERGRYPASPLSPFRTPFPKEFSHEVYSGPIEDKNAICQIYKISLEMEIGGQAVIVDPDMACDP